MSHFPTGPLTPGPLLQDKMNSKLSSLFRDRLGTSSNVSFIAQRQKYIFSANWISRGLSLVLRTFPATADWMLVTGLENDGVLVKLKNSARNSRLLPSRNRVRLKFLNNPKSK